MGASTFETAKKKRLRCRCYINVKTYARQAAKGGPLKGYKPCPVHDLEHR